MPLAEAQFPIIQTFKNSTASGWSFLGSAELTGDGSPDPIGDGWLRLTAASGSQAGSAIYGTAFSTTNGIVATFQYATYGGDGADGFSFYLIDGSTATPTVGGLGGALGYASNFAYNPDQNGVTNGYVGIAFDEWGNFADPEVGSGGPGRTPELIAIRGSGSLLAGFNYLTGSAITGAPFNGVDGVTRANARWARIYIVNGKISVQIDPGSGYSDDYQPV